MWQSTQPTAAQHQRFLARQAAADFAYAEVGATQGEFPPGFDHDRNFCLLGHGQAVFESAKQAIAEWRMFPAAWTAIFPNQPPQTGARVGLQFHLLGLYWLSAAKIVYTVDESAPGIKSRYGFAYGTLPDHVETGEERFTVAWMADDSVVYELQAFSRPRYWMAKLGKPLARRWQRRFVQESQLAMKTVVSNTPKC